MNFVVWTLAGVLTGLIAHMLITRKALSGTGNAVTGGIAAGLGAWLLAPLLGLGDPAAADVHGIGVVVALLSAVVGLSVVNLYREGA